MIESVLTKKQMTFKTKITIKMHRDITYILIIAVIIQIRRIFHLIMLVVQIKWYIYLIFLTVRLKQHGEVLC